MSRQPKLPRPGYCFGATVLLALLLFSANATSALAGPSVLVEVPLNKEAGRGGALLIPLRLESGQEVAFIVDTGTTRTMVDKSLVSRLGAPTGKVTINAWGKGKEASMYAAPSLYFGNIKLITFSNVLSWEFSSEASGKALKPMGLLGFDCLRHYCLQLDFQAGKLRLLDSVGEPGAELGKALPIALPPGGGRPYIRHVNLAGTDSTNAPVDPGFLARRDGMTGDYALIDTGFSADGRIGKGCVLGHHSGRFTLPKCVWEGNTYTNLLLGVEEQANLLGLRFLARHLVTLDFPNRTLYLKQTSTGPLQ